MSDVSPSAVVEWLADERKAGRLGIKTSNYYLRDAKASFRWLVKDRRTDDNPLAHLSGMNAALESGRERRTLTEEDFAALVTAARQGGTVRLSPGSDRAMLYTVAAYVGFRAGELASLTPESFDLDSDPPNVTVEAAYSKRRRQDTQSLRPDLAALLRDWSKGKPAGERLWPGNADAPSESWWLHAAAMVRTDLEAAGLPDVDQSGRVFDFHALRHQFISSLAAAGVHPKIAQTLARHSTITLTMDRYSHIGLLDQTAALEKLPPLPLAGPERHRLAATGTEGKSNKSACTPACTEFVQTADSGRERLSPVETVPSKIRQRQTSGKTLELKRFAPLCDSVTTVETGSRPRGGTVDTRDLKSLGA